MEDDDSKNWDKEKRTHLSRPKMKALSLMLWFVSSEYWLTFENRLWRIRVDGPERDKHTNMLPIST